MINLRIMAVSVLLLAAAPLLERDSARRCVRPEVDTSEQIAADDDDSGSAHDTDWFNHKPRKLHKLSKILPAPEDDDDARESALLAMAQVQDAMFSAVSGGDSPLSSLGIAHSHSYRHRIEPVLCRFKT